ncbi:MAG: o-succinylbenzoate--CoA ligase [bacterium]|nr:o-succinylbenzoate--CoA ligase [bacterium]
MNTPPHIFPLEEAAKKFGESPALVSSNVRISYEDYYARVESLSTGLRSKGISERDRIAVFSENSIEYVLTLFALFQIGAVAVPLNVHLPEKSLTETLKKLKIDKVIVSEEFMNVDLSNQCNICNINELAETAKQEKPYRNSDIVFNAENDATVFLTSGSTSEPKAVLHSLGGHINSAKGSNRNIAFGKGCSWLLSLPLYHVGGFSILFRAISGGGTVVIPGTDENDLCNVLREYGITHISLVPTQLHRLLLEKHGMEIIKKMQAVILGGGAIPDHLIRIIHEHDLLPVYASYGSTELASQVATSRIGDSWKKGCLGAKVLEHCKVKIADDSEILIKGDSLFRGYIKDDELVKPDDNKGWYHSGDAGYLDEDGFLRFSGRMDNMFTSGGENIHPENIEREICKIDGIIESVVVPVPDREYGHLPVAFVQTQQGFVLNKDDIERELRTRLAGIMIPARFLDFPDDMAVTGIKTGRKLLKDLAVKLIGN